VTQRVLVTGASSGIGAATAVAFARAGATVGICARRADRLETVLEECRTESPACRAWTVDLADLAGIDAFAGRVLDDLGGLDVLVNNAGVPKRRMVRAMTAADAEEVMRINYLSPVRLTLAVLPTLLAQGSGHVVNVSSMGAHMVAFGTGAYAASKAALEMFTEAMYLELVGTGVHAHLLVPGSTSTEFSAPREGNDPPLPSGGEPVEPEVVAAGVLACLEGDELVTYATERDAATAAAKAADPNRFVADLRDRLRALGR
jgi:short-subunit dehydrogenase